MLWKWRLHSVGQIHRVLSLSFYALTIVCSASSDSMVETWWNVKPALDDRSDLLMSASDTPPTSRSLFLRSPYESRSKSPDLRMGSLSTSKDSNATISSQACSQSRLIGRSSQCGWSPIVKECLRTSRNCENFTCFCWRLGFFVSVARTSRPMGCGGDGRGILVRRHDNKSRRDEKSGEDEVCWW